MIKIGLYKRLPCLTIKVVPGASKTAIQNYENELRITIAAPPEKGKANQELIAFLSKKLDIRKSEIEIAQGETSRIKLVIFTNCPENLLQEKLEKMLVTK